MDEPRNNAARSHRNRGGLAKSVARFLGLAIGLAASGSGGSTTQQNLEEPSRGYEDSDVSVGRLMAFAGGVVALVVLGVLGSAVVFHFFVAQQPLGPPASPFENVRTLPPEPRLQTAAPLDLKHYRADQDKILEGYGWVDPQAGIVRIPVDRAMDLLLQKGYPIRGSSPVKGQRNTPGPAPPPPDRQIAPQPVGGEEVH